VNSLNIKRRVLHGSQSKLRQQDRTTAQIPPRPDHYWHNINHWRYSGIFTDTWFLDDPARIARPVGGSAHGQALAAQYNRVVGAQAEQ